MKQIDQGIVLHRINYSDTSLILSIYTRESGIRKFIFQGGKKKSSALYPMSTVEFAFYKRPDSELVKLTGADSIDGATDILFHPMRSTIAFFMADVLRNCLKAEQKDTELYNFVIRKIEELNTTNDFGYFPLHFLVELTDQLGIFPQFESESAHVFILDEGEFRNHSIMTAYSEEGPAVDLLKVLFTNMEHESVLRTVRIDALNVLLRYFQFHIPGFNVNRSMEVLKEVLA